MDLTPPERYERLILGMTKIEAAEEILFGKPYLRCSQCNGEGTICIAQIHDEFSYESCRVCNGDGWRIRTNYGVACAALEREMPPKPLSGFEVKQRGMQVRNEIGASFLKTFNAESPIRQAFVKMPINDDT